MTDRERALRELDVGDIFHGRSPNGASLVCLVTAVDEGTIFARRIHTQHDLKFDRNTGFQIDDGYGKIDCVTPFPPDIHRIFLDMDRKYREFQQLSKSGVDPDLSLYKLTDDEVKALLFIDEHVSSNPLESLQDLDE